MRIVPSTILAYVVLGIQLGVGVFAELGSSSGDAWAQPNFVMLAVLYITLNAPRNAALLGCFVLGAMQDLVTQQPFGLFALSYGLTALALAGTTQAMYRDH